MQTPIQDRPTREQVLYLLKLHGRMTVKELSQALSITPMGVRQHLEVLAREGLITHEWVRRGRGRPSQVFSLTPQGDERFPRAYEQLLLSLLADLESLHGPETVEALFVQRMHKQREEYQRRLAGRVTLRERVAELARVRHEEGYLAGWEQVDEHTFVLVEHNCPVRAVAAAHVYPCRYELQLFASLFPDAQVEREELLVTGQPRCRYVIRAASASS